MSNTNAIVAVDATETHGDMADMFDGLPDIDLFDEKKDEVATHLAALMSFAKQNRSSMAERLQWKRSRVTNVLSGNGNPTIKTIWEFCNALDYDFDVVFRAVSEQPAKQPWQKSKKLSAQSSDLTHQRHYFPEVQITPHTPAQVFFDVVNGEARPIYFSLDYVSHSLSPIEIGRQALELSTSSPFVIPAIVVNDKNEIQQT